MTVAALIQMKQDASVSPLIQKRFTLTKSLNSDLDRFNRGKFPSVIHLFNQMIDPLVRVGVVIMGGVIDTEPLASVFRLLGRVTRASLE